MNSSTNKIILVTGATSGIGKAAATAFASQGHTVIAVGRSPEKTRQVVAQIQAVTGSQNLHSLLADFSDLQQVRALAQTVQENFPRLDVLLNNAGGYYNFRVIASSGMEMTLHVNHLAPFLLTNLLLDLLRRSGPSRIVNVASNAHFSSEGNFDDLAYRRFYFGFTAYKRSKLANVLFTYELARRMAGSSITVNALHPGFVDTNIFRIGIPIVDPLIRLVASRSALTVEQGADNSIYLSTSPEVEGITGKYFDERQPIRSSPLTYDENLARRLWEVSEEKAGLVS